jgi:hypothetical protein
MAKRKEYNISVKANVTANLPPEEIKKLERQIRKIRGQVNVEGIDYSKVKALREYNNELREYNRQTERAKRNQGLTLGDYFAEARRKKQRELHEEFERNRPVLPQRQNVSLSHADLKRAMLSDIELETRLRHGAAVPIDSHTFVRNRGDVAYRAYLTRADPSTGRPGGNIVVVPFKHGPDLFQELSKMNVDMNSVNAITEVIRNLQKEPSSPYTRAILPPLLELRRHGIFDDSVFSSQLARIENRRGTQTLNRVMEAYIRELTRAGYPVQPSRLTGGLTHDYRSFQGSREWLKYLLQSGYAEQLLFDVQLPIQSLLAKPTTQFAFHILNSGVRPYIATEKAYQFAEQRGYNKIPGWESIRFDPEYYYDPVNYKTVEPRRVSKPGRRIAIIPSDDIYNPSYIPLTTGLKRNIAGFDPSIFNPEIASALTQAIYPKGGDVPAWDYMTNRYIRDFDYHKYIAYSSELEYLVRSGPITRSQLARNLEKQLFSGNIFSNTIGGLNRDMMYRADWFTDKRLLTTVPTYIDALSVMSGIAETLSKHLANAKEHGLFEYSSILNPNVSKYTGISLGDMLNMIDMFTVLSRRGVPSLHDAKNPLLGPGIFQHPANERELIALQSMLGDLPLYEFRQELYRLATIPDRNATLANLDIDERALEMNALANALKKIQDEEAAKERSAAEHIRGFRRGGSSLSNYFARLRREDPDDPDRGDPDAVRANRQARKMGKPAAVPWSRTLIPTFQALTGGGFSHKWRPEMFTEEQLALLSSDIIEKANAEIYNEINKSVLAEFQKQLGSKNVPGYLVQRATASRFNALFKTRGTGGKYDIMLLQKAFDLAGIPYEDMLSLDPEYETRGGFKYLGNIIPPSEFEEPIYKDPEEAKLRAELEELDRLRESIPHSDIDTRKYIVSRRAEIYSELERLQAIDDRAGIGRNYPAELEERADIIKIPGTDYEVIPREVDPSSSGASPRFLRHEAMFDNLMGKRLKNLQNYLKLSKNLKSLLPLAGVSLAAIAAGSIFGSPELAMMGAMPFALMGSTKKKPLTQDELLEKLNNAIERRDVLEKAVQSTSEPIRKKKLQEQLDNILNVIEDTERKYRNYDEYLKSFGQATPDKAPSDTPDYSSFLEYTPWKKGDDIYKVYGTLGYDIRGQGFPEEAITFQQTLREELSKLPFFQQHPEELENFKVYIATDTNFQNYDVGGRAFGTLRVRGKADLRKLGDVSDKEYAETAKQIDQVTKSVIDSTSATDKYAESMLVTAQATKDSGKELNTFAKYSEKMGRISWIFTLVSMNALGVFFSMMSVNNMLMQGINMVMTPLMDLDKLMQSYALSQAFVSKTGIDMKEIMEEQGITIQDVIDGWETMTGFISNIQWGLGMLGANILGDPDTYDAIQKAVEKIVRWLTDPETGKQLADVMENLADILPQLIRALPSILKVVGVLTTPFDPNAKEDDWLGNQSLFSLMLYGQIFSMFAMPILSIISLLYRIAQGILWLGGLISGWKAASTLLGGGEGALLGGGGALAGSKIYRKLFGNAPKGGYATGAAEMEALAAREIGLIPRISAMFTGPGSWMGKAAGPLGVLFALSSLVEPVGGNKKDYSWRTSGPIFGIDENGNIIQIGMMENKTPKSTPKFNNYPPGIDNNVPEWAKGISDIDPSNISEIYNKVYGTSNINFDQMGSNFNRNMTSMKETTEDAAVAAAAFNNNLTFAGFQRESGLNNVTFKQENHFEINVQGSLDEKSTPNLFSGLASLLAGRWS